MSNNFNPKKNNKDRRVRSKINKPTKAIAYAEVKHKSKSGVEYTHYEKVIVNI